MKQNNEKTKVYFLIVLFNLKKNNQNKCEKKREIFFENYLFVKNIIL